MSTLTTQLEASVAIERAKAGEIMPVAPTPTGILQHAIMNGADIDQMTKLLELQERWEAGEARKAYNVAFSAFKAEAVTIIKNVAVSDGPLKGKRYADLFGVVSAITPLLSKHGLSHSWKLTKDEPAWMEVTCTLRHTLGHSETVSMGSAPDTGPGRNAIQARASAVNYLERYTLLAATGTAAAGQDNDGNGAGKEMDHEEIERIVGLIEGARHVNELKDIYLSAIKQSDAVSDKKATARFVEAKEARKKELA